MIIEDGTGKGFKAKINDENALLVRACIESCQRHMSIIHGEGYTAPLGTVAAPFRTVTAAGGYMMYLRNDNSDYNMVIGRITVTTSALIVMRLERNPTLGAIANVDTIVPVNKNYTSGNKAEATCGGWDGVGDGITNITAGTVVGTWQINTGIAYNAVYDESVILGVDDILVLYAIDAANLTVNVHFYYNMCDSQ